MVILAATFRSLKMNEPSSQGRKSHYSKDLDQSQGFGVRLLYNSCTVFHEPKTRLQVNVVVRG